MAIHNPWLARRKWILVPVALVVLVALWWAFRPEKLWITKRVNEPAPFASNGPQPIFTGRFEGKAQPTSGRATIYKKPGGAEYLRLSDFTTASGADVHILLARSDDRNLAEDVARGGIESIDCGPLKSNQGDQDYDLLAAADPNKYDAVVVYGEQSHAVFGLAKLEPF
jgi:Electron transfer DM13